jgi:hypothetical protein
LLGGGSSFGSALGGDVTLVPGLGAGGFGNISLGTNTPSAGGGKRVVFLKNCATAPSSPPVDGVIIYAQGGALYALGSSGTSTLLAPA